MLLPLFASVAAAMEVRTGETVIIGPHEVVSDDLYVAAARVRIEGEVRGDVLAAAQEIEIEGSIQGDLVAAGERVVLRGQIGDDLRAAAGLLRIDRGGAVQGDLVAGAGAVETDERAVIGGDAAIGAGQALVAGRLGGELTAGAGALRLDGAIGGDVEAFVGGPDEPPPVVLVPGETLPSLPAGLTLGPNARIDGRLAYRSPSEAAVDPGAITSQGTEYTPEPARKTPFALSFLRRYLGLLAVGGIALLAAPRFLDRAAEAAGRPLHSLLVGILALASGLGGGVAIAVLSLAAAALVGAVTLGDLVPPALLLGFLAELGWIGAFALAAGWLAQVAVALAAGGRLVHHRAGGLAVGLLVFAFLWAIPGIGAVVNAVAALVGLGAVVVALLPAARRAASAEPTGVAPAPAK